MSEVTLILERAQQGDPKAAEELLPLVYEVRTHRFAALDFVHAKTHAVPILVAITAEP